MRLVWNVIVIILLIPFFLGGCDDNYRIPLFPNEQFTEEVAIRVSREALKRSGMDISKMQPVSYRNESFRGENLLARNTLNTNQGYMLWHETDGKGLYQYSVSMEKIDNYIICRIGKTK